MKDYPNVHILDHPLIRHKVAHLRDVRTNTKDFREIITEVATLMAYESFKDVPTETVTVQTPFEKVEQQVVKNDSVAIIPILRAGLGMFKDIDLNDSTNLYVVAAIFICGIGALAFKFVVGGYDIVIDGIAAALIVGIVTNLLCRSKSPAAQ